MDVLRKEVYKNIFLLLLILNKSCSCSFPKELHEPPLHHQPEQAGDVEENCQEHQVERHPLVVGIIYNRGSVLVPLMNTNTSQVLGTNLLVIRMLDITGLNTIPLEQAPLYLGGTFQVEYIQQYDSSTSFSTPSDALIRNIQYKC